MSQTKIETPQSRSCRGARGGLSAFERRRSPAPAGMPRQSLGAYPQRSPRSQARANAAERRRGAEAGAGSSDAVAGSSAVCPGASYRRGAD